MGLAGDKETGTLSMARIEIGIDAVDILAMTTFWSKALGYEVGDLDPAGVYMDLIPPDDKLPPVFLQQVGERPVGKNSLHIDIYTKNFDLDLERLLRLGACLQGGRQSGSQGGLWQVLTDIEGNYFCLCAACE
ncbi:MAG: VOC family protein [Firmicutes bacterium]|nr:VOC family protein [Bacillota bacterium]